MPDNPVRILSAIPPDARLEEEPTFADLHMDLDRALAMLQHARDCVLDDVAQHAAWSDTELAATLATLQDCARWVGQIRRLNGCVDGYLAELAARAGAPFQSKLLPNSPPGLTWFCTNCDDRTELNRHGYCERCGSDSVQVVAHAVTLRSEVGR